MSEEIRNDMTFDEVLHALCMDNGLDDDSNERIKERWPEWNYGEKYDPEKNSHYQDYCRENLFRYHTLNKYLMRMERAGRITYDNWLKLHKELEERGFGHDFDAWKGMIVSFQKDEFKPDHLEKISSVLYNE